MKHAEAGQARGSSSPALQDVTASWIERVGSGGPADRLWSAATALVSDSARAICVRLRAGIVAIGAHDRELAVALAPGEAAPRLVLYAVQRKLVDDARPRSGRLVTVRSSAVRGDITIVAANGEELVFGTAQLRSVAAGAAAILEGRDTSSDPDPWRRIARARRRGRRRQTASLCLRTGWPLRALVSAASRTRLGPSVTPQTSELSRDDGFDALASGHAELADADRLFGLLGGHAGPQQLRNRLVLDLGCGYGGRTIYYARRCGARHVEGVEIAARIVERCRALAERVGCENVSFRVGLAERLPYEDESFETVISFDVLEHVEDPVQAFAEIARVIRPGGSAWLVFPTYLGARSSHLDYLTKVPALHRLFDPVSIVDNVNDYLIAEPERFGVSPQPLPRVGVLGRLTLPTLNGLTLREAQRLAPGAGLRVEEEVLTPIVTAALPLAGARLLGRPLELLARRDALPELLVANIGLILRKQ